MRVVISADVLGDDGSSLYHYSRGQNAVFDGDLQSSTLHALILVVAFTEEAREQIGEQAKIELPQLPALQEKLDALLKQAKPE